MCVPAGALEDPTISNAKGIYLYNLENNKAVYSLNVEEQIYPTSTVKIMTGILAIENLSGRLDETITVTAEMLSEVRGNNIGLAAGEMVTIDSMIRALLVNGANDAAYVLAYTISGSAQEFVTQMNTKAKELGAHLRPVRVSPMPPRKTL